MAYVSTVVVVSVVPKETGILKEISSKTLTEIIPNEAHFCVDYDIIRACG